MTASIRRATVPIEATAAAAAWEEKLMRGRRILAVVAPVLLGGLALGAPISASASGGTSYYLALGDSLAAGFQPTLRGPVRDAH